MKLAKEVTYFVCKQSLKHCVLLHYLLEKSLSAFAKKNTLTPPTIQYSTKFLLFI